jgi:hypothetical protein
MSNEELQRKVREAGIQVVMTHVGCDRNTASELFDVVFQIGFMYGKMAAYEEAKDLLK